MNEKIAIIKSSIFASSPDEIKDLTQKIIDEQIKNRIFKSICYGTW